MDNTIKANDSYEYVLGYDFIGCYSFIENEDTHEHYWADSQNCEYHIYNEDEGYDKDTSLINGNNWWIIWICKPIGEKVTKDNAKWFVIESSKEDDMNKEWDFKTHKPI